jgi:hypothetical protein
MVKSPVARGPNAATVLEHFYSCGRLLERNATKWTALEEQAGTDGSAPFSFFSFLLSFQLERIIIALDGVLSRFPVLKMENGVLARVLPFPGMQEKLMRRHFEAVENLTVSLRRILYVEKCKSTAAVCF